MKQRSDRRNRMTAQERDQAEADFKAAVRARDGWRCRYCAGAGHEVHHSINRRNEQWRFDPRNGVLLCRPCHQGIELHQVDDWADWQASPYADGAGWIRDGGWNEMSPGVWRRNNNMEKEDQL